MRSLPLLLLILAFRSAFAQEPVMDPVCRGRGAETVPVTVGADASGGAILCKFGMASYIDRGSVGNAVSGFGTLAVRNYRDSGNGPVGSHCTSFGAMLAQATDDWGRPYTLCRFFDGSMMEDRTFMMGPQSGFNREMDWALGIGL